MFFHQIDGLCTYRQDQRPTILNVAEIVEFAHTMQTNIVILLVVRHFADVVLVPEEQAFLIEHDPVCIDILWLKMVHRRDFLVVLNVDGGDTFPPYFLFDQFFS